MINSKRDTRANYSLTDEEKAAEAYKTQNCAFVKKQLEQMRETLERYPIPADILEKLRR